MATTNLFVSHAWKYNEDAIKLKTKLQERGYFNVEFYDVGNHDPINSGDDNYISRKLKEQLDQTHVLLCFNRKYSTSSKWITFELEQAKNRSIPIIGINMPGISQGSSLVQEYTKIIVNYNIETIVKTIRECKK